MPSLNTDISISTEPLPIGPLKLMIRFQIHISLQHESDGRLNYTIKICFLCNQMYLQLLLFIQQLPLLINCSPFQPLDFESRRSFTFRVEVMNTIIDPQYIRRGPFKDVTTVRITVGDVKEPPYFSQDPYILSVQENLPPGTLVGMVEAKDPDLQSSSIR